MFSWLTDKGLTASGKIAWGTILATVFLVPITMSQSIIGTGPVTADIFDTPKVWLLRVLVMVALSAWSIDIFTTGGKIRFNKWMSAGLGLLALSFAISTVLSIEPMQSFLGKYRRYEGLWSLLLYIALFWLVTQYATGRVRMKQVMQFLSASSILVAGYGIFQALGIELFPWSTLPFEVNRSFSTYGNPDLLAGFLAFGFFINLGLALAEKQRLSKTYYWLATLINGAVIVTAFARSIWVGTFVGLILLVVLMFRQRHTFDGEDFGFIGVTVATIVAFIVRSMSSSDAVMNFAARFTSIFKFGEGSAVTRFEIWDAAMKATMDRPVFGWGPDSFRMVFRMFQPPAYAQDAGYRSVADNTHNYVLQLTSSIGILGMALMYGVQLLILGFAAKLCWQKDTLDLSAKSKVAQMRAAEALDGRRSSKMLYTGMFVACCTYMVHLFFGLSLPGATFLLWVFLAVLAAPHCVEIEVAPAKMGIVYGVLVCILACVPVWYATQLLRADMLFLQGQAQAQSQPVQSVETLSKAMELNPYNDQYELARIQTYLQMASTGETDVETVVKATDDLVANFPNEYDVFIMALSVYNTVGKVNPDVQNKALEIGDAAVAKFPEGLALRFAYASLLEAAGQTDAAIEQLQYCVDHDTNFADAQSELERLSGEN